MSIAADNLLLKAKSDVYHRLLGDAFLANVPILLDDEGDREKREAVKRATKNVRNSKTGACVIVQAIGVLGVSTTNTPTPLMEIAIVMEVLEDVPLNATASGTGINAGEIVARLVQTLHWSHYDDRFTGLSLATGAPIAELDGMEPGMRGFVVNFAAREVAFQIVPTVSDVTISQTDDEITLACATSGAAIYYTTDGTYPGSGNADASLYSAPFTATTGTVIRAGAEKADMNPAKYIAQHTAT